MPLRRVARLLRFPAALLLPLFFCAPAAAQEAPAELAARMVTAVARELTEQRETMRSPRALETGHAIVNRLIAPQVDFERLTRDVTGAAWDGASAAQRTELQEEFRKLLVHVIARLLATYNDEKLEVVPAPLAADATEAEIRINVTATRSPGDEPPGPMFAYFHKTAGGWKIRDFRGEGILLVRLYAANFSVVLARDGGVDGLVRALKERNARNAQAVGAKS